MTSAKIALLRAECLAQIDKLAEESIVHEKNKSALESITHNLFDVANLVDKTVHLNVGGANVYISRANIISHVSENYLFTLLSGKYNHLLPKDKNGRIFLDLDVKWVEPEFNWLRDMAMWSGDKQSMPKLSRPQLLHDLGRNIVEKHFFLKSNFDCIDGYSNDNADAHFSGSIILANEEKLHNAESVLVDMLTVEGGPYVSKCDLLYQASDSDISEEAFHSACDGIENVLVIVKDTEGNMLGGFSDTACDCDIQKAAPKAFLFSLVKDKVFSPIKHKGKKKNSAIMCHANMLLVFTDLNGCSYDLCLRSPPTSNSNTYNTYSFTQVGYGGFEEQSHGLQKQTRRFQIQDMEVYRIIYTTSVSALQTASKQLEQHVTVLGKRKTVDMTLALETELLAAQSELLESVKKVCAEQKFIAKFLGVNVPTTTVNDGSSSEFQLLLHEIQMIDKLLTAGNDLTRDISDAVSSTVYINVGGVGCEQSHSVASSQWIDSCKHGE